MQTGKILVFSAPSGSGKTTLVHYLMSQVPGLHFSISATSRSPRPGEVDGRDYYFLSPDEFRRRIAAGSGRTVQEVNQLLKQWGEMNKMMGKMRGLANSAGGNNSRKARRQMQSMMNNMGMGNMGGMGGKGGRRRF